MTKLKFTETQIVSILKQADAGVPQGHLPAGGHQRADVLTCAEM